MRTGASRDHSRLVCGRRLSRISYIFSTQTTGPAACREWLETIEFNGRLCGSRTDVTIDVAAIYTPAHAHRRGRRHGRDPRELIAQGRHECVLQYWIRDASSSNEAVSKSTDFPCWVHMDAPDEWWRETGDPSE